MAKKQKTEFEVIVEKLDKISTLLEHLLAVQLYKGNATQDEIAKNLHIRKASINKMVKGLRKQDK
ncbi:MAG: hypothetical protein ABI543_10840 [Ignavibacteria bacterium]